jgi:hypothetical protein
MKIQLNKAAGINQVELDKKWYSDADVIDVNDEDAKVLLNTMYAGVPKFVKYVESQPKPVKEKVEKSDKDK